MDETEFWALIESSRAKAKKDPERQMEALQTKLEKLPAAEIVAFDRIFGTVHAAAYRWDLWAAAYIIEGGCSDDGFMDFRSGLIALGRDTYDAALADPESLARLSVDTEFSLEEMAYVAASAYEAVTGQALPERGLLQPEEPAGERWDEATVGLKYPKLVKKFDSE